MHEATAEKIRTSSSGRPAHGSCYNFSKLRNLLNGPQGGWIIADRGGQRMFCRGAAETRLPPQTSAGDQAWEAYWP